MAVNLSPVGGVAAQFFTNTGAVLTGGKLFTYLAGTTTPAAAYTSSNGVTAWTNPIVLNAGGRVPGSGEIWLTDGILYKFVLEDANNVLIATYDNISGINSNFVAFTNQQEIVTATAGQTVFNLGISYQPGTNSLSVFVDGVNQYGPGAQYAYLETDADTVTFVSGLHVGAEVKFTTSQLNNAAGQTAAQTAFTGFKGQIGTVQDLADGDGSDWIGFTQAGTGAVAVSAQDKMRQIVSVKDFGAVGNGIANDTQPIVDAVAFCQASSQTSLYFPTGIYRIQSTITLGAGSTNGIAFVGETAAPQQGSARPAVTLRWHGGAAPMFDIQYTYFSFYNMAFENFTNATDALLLTGAMHMVLDNCSFVLGNGSTRFSRSILHADGNEFGYSVVQNCTIQNSAPRFLDIDGATGNGITPVLFYNNVIESNAAGAHTVVYVKNEGIDILTFNGNTINGQANAQLTLVDTTDTPLSETITVLNVYDNEFDLVSNTATDRMFRLTNVSNANFWGNQYQGGGSATAAAELVNSVVTQFSGNHLLAIGGPFFNADSTSRVYSQANNVFTANTKGIVNDTATTSGMIQMTYGATVTILGEKGVGTGHTVFRVDATDTAGFTLTFSHPGIGGNGYFTRGQVLSVQVRNTSGGVIPSITLAGGATYWSLSGGAFPIPANGNSRTVTFVWSGSKLVEIGRTAADVPN